jgi:hypothetical protein
METAGGLMGVKVGQYNVTLNETGARKDPVAFLKKLVEVMQQYFDSKL